MLKHTGQTHLEGQGWYDNPIWVDPTNPNNLIIGGVDLFRSTNGGMTLTPMSDWNFGPGSASPPTSAHADHHAIVSAPGFNGVNNTTVFFGNDGDLLEGIVLHAFEGKPVPSSAHADHHAIVSAPGFNGVNNT